MKLPITYFLLILTFTLFGQDTDSISEINQKKAEYEERVRRMKEMEKKMAMFEKDPKRYMDSVNALRKIEAEEAAIMRLAKYEINNRLDTIKELDLSDARLSRLPEFVSFCENLEVLRIDNNNFRKLPRQLKKHKNLIKIYWRKNELKRDIRFTNLPDLKILHLESNDINRIPTTRKFKNLEALYLDNNKFEKIPINKIKRNKLLKELVISSNPVLLEKDKYYLLDHLKTLKINKCELERIDPSFYEMGNLIELQLLENKLVKLPNGISKLTNLTKLSLYKNDLSELPEDLFDLKGLILIDLYYNELQRIPKSLERAQNLEVLFLAYNHIFDLPEEVGNLPKLKELYIHHNRLSVLPESLANLKELQVLRVNDNYLNEFPTQILSLSELNDLDVDNNDIMTIPTTIQNLKKLKLFTFSGNAVDFNDPENQGLAQVIVAMGNAGVVCKPSLSIEYVDEKGNLLDQ